MLGLLALGALLFDDVILDPFAGSGTVCLAALKDHRKFVAYDIDPHYVELAVNRIAAHRNGL